MLVDYTIKNIRRQKSRTALTVLGIIIGITMIIALGSISEGITQYISGAMELTAGKIMITQKGSGGFMAGFQGSDITEEQLEELRLMDGVKEVTPMGFLMGRGGSGFGPTRVIVGIDPASSEDFVGENVGLKDGRELLPDDSEVAMIGFDRAENEGLEVGDFITIEEADFEVIGVVEKTDNANVDGSIIVNVRDVQDLLKTDTYQVAYVIPFSVEDSETMAEAIESEFEDLDAVTSKDMARQAASVTSQMQLYTMGLGAISAVVGGLGIMNTMVMAVLERRKEIGVMKAIGATRLWIVKQFLAESAIISIIGGLAGVGAGSIIVALIGMALEGIPLKVTPYLAGVGIGFALSLGFLGGVYPSWKAANLDPVDAIRYG